MDRLGSCWWGCCGGAHTVEYAVAASSGNAFAAFRLLQAAYYDESLSIVRQIAERANLLQLFLFDEGSRNEWASTDPDVRRVRFNAYNIRIRLEQLDVPPVVSREHYRSLSEFGIHPGRTPQVFGEDFPPTPGGHFRTRGMLITLSELTYAVAMVGGSGAVLVGPDDRIPADRIVNTARELLKDQQKLHDIIEKGLGSAESE